MVGSLSGVRAQSGQTKINDELTINDKLNLLEKLLTRSGAHPTSYLLSVYRDPFSEFKAAGT